MLGLDSSLCLAVSNATFPDTEDVSLSSQPCPPGIMLGNGERPKWETEVLGDSLVPLELRSGWTR